jgi:hypothetical protein
MDVFVRDALVHSSRLSAVRSYLRLYSSIKLDKLATFAGLDVVAVRALLAAAKLAAWQRQGGTDRPAHDGPFGSSDPLHFVVKGDVVAVSGGDVEAPRAVSYLAKKIVEIAKVRDAVVDANDSKRPE